MKTKKILSFVMALAMALSLSVTALATPLSSQSGDSLTHAAQYTGTTSVPVINLAVSNINNTLAFNPYKLTVILDSDGQPTNSGGANSPTMDDQFITKEITITNKTNVPLKMTGALTVTTSVDSSTATAPTGAKAAELTNKSIAATETEKKLYVYADFYAYDDDYEDVPELTKTAAAAHRLVAATSGTAVSHTTAAARVTLQADVNGATDGGENFVYVKVNGEATPSPSTPWGAYDKVNVGLTFTFQSEPNYTKYAVVVKGTNTSDFTVNPVYSKENVKVTASGTGDLTANADKKVVGGAVCYIVPVSGKKITAVKFYDKTGTTAITTVRAASTNTKDATAPWSFTMPADNVVMEVTTS